MKKIFFLIFIIAVFIGTLFSGTISISHPLTGEELIKSNRYLVRWNATGTTNGFKITLWKNGTRVKIIDGNITAGNGERRYPWNVDAECGDGYQIKVKEKSSPVSGMSGNFKIKGCLNYIEPRIMFKLHSIKLIQPNGGESLPLNGSYLIRWKPKNLTSPVKITLWKDGVKFGVIAKNIAPRRVSYEWVVGRTLLKSVFRTGSGYKIKIKEQGVKIVDESDRSFSIVAPKNVDLSCYISGHSSTDHGRKAVLTVKVRVNNIGREILKDVPVKVSIRTGDEPELKEQTKTIREITYRGSRYEYSIDFTFKLHGGRWNDARRSLAREAVVVVDPEDIFRDYKRINNSSTYRFSF